MAGRYPFRPPGLSKMLLTNRFRLERGFQKTYRYAQNRQPFLAGKGRMDKGQRKEVRRAAFGSAWGENCARAGDAERVRAAVIIFL